MCAACNPCQPRVPQVLFLRDTTSYRLTPDTALQSPRSAPALAADGGQHDDCEAHDHCDHDSHEAHGHSHGEHFAWLLDTQALGPKALVPLLLTIVLSVHSFIAGMALGVEESDAAAVPTLIAILAHKWVEAISLGVSVVRVTPDRRILLRCCPVPAVDICEYSNAVPVRVLVIFGAMSPLGIFAGWALQALTSGLLQDVVSAGMLPCGLKPHHSICNFASRFDSAGGGYFCVCFARGRTDGGVRGAS